MEAVRQFFNDIPTTVREACKKHKHWNPTDSEKRQIRSNAHNAHLSQATQHTRLGLPGTSHYYKALHGHSYGASDSKQQIGGFTGGILGIFKGFMY